MPKCPVYGTLPLMNKTINVEKKLTKGPQSTIVATCTIAAKDFAPFYTQAMEQIKKNVTVAGFRDGKAPDAMIEKQVGDFAVTQEMAEIAIHEAMVSIVESEKITLIGQPKVTISKIARDNDLEFTLTFPVMPEIKLGEYKKIAKEIMNKTLEVPPVTDEEVAKTLEELRNAHKMKLEKEGATDVVLPELTDTFAQTVGDFKTLEDLKAHIKKSTEAEKTHQASEKRRVMLLDAIAASGDFETPQTLIDHHASRMLAELSGNLAQFNMTLEAYLTQIKKTEEEMKKEIEPTAAKRAKLELVIGHIAKMEKIEADELKVNEEVDHMMEHYKTGDRKVIQDYVTYYLTNEAVIEFLEKQK